MSRTRKTTSVSTLVKDLEEYGETLRSLPNDKRHEKLRQVAPIFNRVLKLEEEYKSLRVEVDKLRGEHTEDPISLAALIASVEAK